MTRWQRSLRGLALGAALGGLLFFADLAGAAIAIGFLFDPSVASFLLVALAGLTTVGTAGAIGALAGLLWPSRWSIAWPRRRWALLAGALFGVTLAIGWLGRSGRAVEGGGERAPVTAQRPVPVLWVVVDTLRADTAYGTTLDFPHMPELGVWAADAVLFTDAEAAAGWTLPSMATLFSGLQPTALEAYEALPDWAPTVAERLAAAGYATHAVVDNALLERRNGYAAGFESWFQKSGLRFAHSLPGFRLMGGWARRKLRESTPTYYYGAPRLTDVALERLAEEDRAPLFLYVHYMDPHYPYYAHPELAPDPPEAESMTLPWKTLRQQGGVLRPGQMTFLRSRYEGEAQLVDRELARLLAAWDERFGSDSVVMITSDHGEEFLDHGSLGHGNNLHPELVRVPLLLRLPGSEGAARSIDHPVGLVDLLPTTLDLLGIPAELAAARLPLHGASWLPWLRGEEPAPRRPLVAAQSFRGKRITRFRQGRWVRVHTVEPKTDAEIEALYDTITDPAEQTDRSSDEASRVAGMRELLAEQVEADRAMREAGAGASERNEEALRALGYVE